MAKQKIESQGYTGGIKYILNSGHGHECGNNSANVFFYSNGKRVDEGMAVYLFSDGNAVTCIQWAKKGLALDP